MLLQIPESLHDTLFINYIILRQSKIYRGFLRESGKEGYLP